MSKKITKKRPKRRTVLMAALVLLVIMSVVFIRQNGSRGGPPFDTTALKRTIAGLPQRAGTHPAMRLKTGLVPPTNKWFSSLVFSTAPQPIYAQPLTFKPSPGGFEASYPAITSAAATIFQAHAPAVSTAFGAAAYSVSDYDDLSVGVTHANAAGQAIATTKITHGSPFVFTTAEVQLSVTISSVGKIERVSDRYYLLTYNGKRHGVYADAAITQTGGGLRFNIEPGKHFSVFALPDQGDVKSFETYATRPVTGSKAGYREHGKTITTTFEVQTRGGQPTLFALMPHQKRAGRPLAAFGTLYGELKAYEGTSFTYDLPLAELPAKLNLSKLAGDKKDELKEQVTRGVAATTLTKTDPYFGGKELQRAANLLDLADQLDLHNEKQQLIESLRGAFDAWLTPGAGQRANKYFYYDTAAKGIVGVEASFGSDQFTDHHFHYGYFIYAAATLARLDSTFMGKHGEMINVLAADIASPGGSALLPKLRVFDPYVGHSWAAGYADFADGNNQESVSEAVNAWYALYLWGQASGNNSLIAHSRWLYQHESEAALRYWLFNDNQPHGKYQAPFTSLVWGGKRDYATWFSPRPQAKLGIILIPMSPGHIYLAATKARARTILDAVAPTDADYHGQFGDYLVMYEALTDPAAARKHAQSLGPADLDDANSRSYLLAWIYSR